MREDISSRSDIEKLITHFYEGVKTNAVIGFIFTKMIKDWDEHIPLIVDFWETILLDNPIYKKNAMQVHFDLNKTIPLQKVYFETWLSLFVLSVDDLYEGKIASLAKTRAKSIAMVMQLKMEAINQNLHI